MEKTYQRINWENEPSTVTPLNEDNLNRIDYAVDVIDTRVVELGSYRDDAMQSAETSRTNAILSQSYAVGGTNERVGENVDNAKYYKEQAESASRNVESAVVEVNTAVSSATVSARNAKESEDNSKISETNAKDSENKAKDSENNAKASEDNAKTSEDNAKTSEDNANSASEIAQNAVTRISSYMETIETAVESASASADRAQEIADSIDYDYTNMRNKPSINGHELVGNLTTEDLEISAEPEGYSDLVATVGEHTTEISTLSNSVTQLNDDLTESVVSQKGLELFGWIAPRLSDDCYDYIEDGVYHKKVGRVDLGSLNWVMTSDGTRFYAITNDLPIKNYTASEKANILCTKYESTPFNGMSALNKVIASYKSGSNVYVSVIDTSYTTKDSFKASVSGVYLYYELATEITRDNNSANVLATIGTTTNLLNPTLQSQVVNGITCTNNGDGTFTLNGTATAETRFKVMDCKIPIGNYKFVGCPNGGSTSTYRMYINLNGSDYGNGIILNLSQEVNQPIIIQVFANVVLNNLVFKPMLTTNLSATYNDFVPFTGTTGKLNGDVAEIKKLLINNMSDRFYSFYNRTLEELDNDLSRLTNVMYVALNPGSYGMVIGFKGQSNYQRQIRLSYWDNKIESRVKTNSTSWSTWV